MRVKGLLIVGLLLALSNTATASDNRLAARDAAKKTPKTTESKQEAKEKWARTAPDKKDLDRAKVDDALFKLTGLEVQEFLDTPAADASYGRDAPAAVVTLKREDNKPALSLRFGKKDGAAYARRPGDAAVLKLDPAKVDEALKAFKEL